MIIKCIGIEEKVELVVYSIFTPNPEKFDPNNFPVLYSCFRAIQKKHFVNPIGTVTCPFRGMAVSIF